MILYPQHIGSSIGFNEIKSILADFAKTEYAKNRASTLTPSSNKSTILHTLNQTGEMQRLIKSYAMPDLSVIDEIKINLKDTMTLGSMPQTSLLFRIKRILSDTGLFFLFFDDVKTSFPTLLYTREPIIIPGSLFELLDKIIDEEGNLNPNASPELRHISEKIINKEKEVRKLLNNRFDVAKKNGWAGDTEITIRNDRLVLPIIAEHKKKIKGFVHDDSASGKFLYIEPLECFEENNQLRELYLERKKEIERILRYAGKVLNDTAEDFVNILGMWEKLDFYRAKAKLNNLLGGNIPEFAQQSQIKLHDAVHPLLLLNARKDNSEEKIVRNSINLNKHEALMLISGPNAGGKSVLLKTVALLQMMFQSGLGITASPTSELFVFEKISVEISDNQSLENALSTYSAHLVDMKYILENANHNTLVIIDEFGTGTDPELASPIAEAMLEMLCETGALGIVSSHLGALKKLPNKISRLVNASMLYDPIALKPMFKLMVGKPGSSYAFELAQNLNLPSKMLENAKSKMKASKTLDYEELSIRAEKLAFELEEAKRNISNKAKHLDKLLKEYELLKNQLQENKKIILQQTREKAAEELLQATSLLKKIKKDSRNEKVTKQYIASFSHQLNQAKETLNQSFIKVKQDKTSVKPIETLPNVAITTGDFVLIADSNQIGEIIEIKKNKALVLLGDLHSWVDLKRLEKLKNQNKVKKSNKNSVPHYSDEIMVKQTGFSHTLDLRGERGEDAIAKVSKWLDDARLISAGQLKILHGKGTGVLKKLIWDFLKEQPFIKSYQFEHADRGGEGSTLVELK